MKKLIALCALLLICCALSAQRNPYNMPGNRVINPVTASPVNESYQVVGIMYSDSITVLILNIAAPEAEPGRAKIYFAPSTSLRDSQTGKRYYLTANQNTPIDQDIYVSNDSRRMVMLNFQPLDKGVEKVDYTSGRTAIMGISLTESTTPAPGMGGGAPR